MRAKGPAEFDLKDADRPLGQTSTEVTLPLRPWDDGTLAVGVGPAADAPVASGSGGGTTTDEQRRPCRSRAASGRAGIPGQVPLVVAPEPLARAAPSPPVVAL